MKSANPLNAPLIPLRCSRTFCRCVCAKWVPAAASADSFILLLFRLHLKSITTNGRLFNCNVSAPSSPAANQTHRIMWPAGGGASGFKTGAPAGPGPDTSPDRSQDQYQQQIAEQQTVGASSSSSFAFVPGVFHWTRPSSLCLDRYAVCSLSCHLGLGRVRSVQPSVLSARSGPGPESGLRPGTTSPPDATAGSWCRPPVTGESQLACYLDCCSVWN